MTENTLNTEHITNWGNNKKYHDPDEGTVGYGDKNCWEHYRQLEQLPAPLYRSLKSCAKRLLDRDDEEEIRKLATKTKSDMKYAAMMYYLQNADVFDVVDNKLEGKLWVYGTTDGYKLDTVDHVTEKADCRATTSVPKEFKIDGKIMAGRNVVVLHGKFCGRKLAVKWSYSRDIASEYDIYVKLKMAGCQVPWFDNFLILGQPVLVLERLRPISRKDNAFYVGMKVMEQLAFVHAIGCHNDIKPQNIMIEDDSEKKVRFEDDTPAQPYLIDYGGVTTEKLDKGFRRQIWTKSFSSQRPGSHYQFTCAKFDYMELVFTVQAILLWQKSPSDTKLGYFKDEMIQTGFHPVLHQIMLIADRLPDDHEKCRLAHPKIYETYKQAYLKSIEKPMVKGLDKVAVTQNL